MRILFSIFILLSLWGCGGMKIIDFEGREPRFVPEEYFDGSLRGHGTFFDRFGDLRRTFVIDLEGTREGDTVFLKEHLRYDDGEEIHRTYKIERIDHNNYVATSESGLVGSASIKSYGNALNWKYLYSQKIKGREWTLRFDDWMFLQNETLVLNRARVTKWGFHVGDLFMSISKLDESKDS